MLDRQDLLTVVQRLLIDRFTAEVVTALAARGVEPILLKGPVVARWLYAESPGERGYSDSDLLVAPAQMAAAQGVLRELGFSPARVRLSTEKPLHASPWLRETDGAVVDLHRTIHGLEDLPDATVWQVVKSGAEELVVAGTTVAVPGPAMRTLHAVLHLDVVDGPGTRAWTDAQRAVESVDPDTWRQAASIAGDLGVASEMGARLRMLPAGERLAAELGLPVDVPVALQLRRAVEEDGAPKEIYALDRLIRLDGATARLRYVAQKVVPPSAFMRQWSPIARRGGAGMAAAYGVRIAWCLTRLPPAVWSWMRLRVRSQAGK